MARLNTLDPQTLFVYGTLQDRAVLGAVLAGPLDRLRFRTASAIGYRAVCYPGAPYPALISCADSTASGLLLGALAPDHLARLDAYEGDEYRRGPVSILVDGVAVSTHTYWPARAISPDAADWSFKHWTHVHRARALAELAQSR